MSNSMTWNYLSRLYSLIRSIIIKRRLLRLYINEVEDHLLASNSNTILFDVNPYIEDLDKLYRECGVALKSLIISNSIDLDSEEKSCFCSQQNVLNQVKEVVNKNIEYLDKILDRTLCDVNEYIFETEEWIIESNKFLICSILHSLTECKGLLSLESCGDLSLVSHAILLTPLVSKYIEPYRHGEKSMKSFLQLIMGFRYIHRIGMLTKLIHSVN